MKIDINKQLRREPQIYKNLELYPILLFETDIYNLFLEIMCMPKDYISNKEILKMSYLKYLLFFLQGTADMNESEDFKTSERFIDKLIVLMEHITKKPVCVKQVIDAIDSDSLSFHYDLYIGEEIYYEYDFDQIREIVLEQNGKNIDYIESFNPELEKSLDILRKSCNYTPLMNRILIYSAISNCDMANMAKWTITEFEEKEDILKTYEEWKLYKPLEASGQIKLKSKDSIKSPFEYEKKTTDRYSSILMNADDFMKDLKQFST